MPNYFYEKAIELSLKFINYTKEMRVLDAGCGTGRLLMKIKDHGIFAQVYGLDIAINRIKVCKEKVPMVSLLLGDVEEMPFKGEYFDAVYLTEVIEHVHNPLKLLAEIHRVLKRKGIIIVTVPNRFAYYPLYAFIRKLPAKWRKNMPLRLFVPGDDPAVSWQNRDTAYSSKEVLSWLNKSNFRAILVQGKHFLLPFSSRLPFKIKLKSIFGYHFYVIAYKLNKR